MLHHFVEFRIIDLIRIRATLIRLEERAIEIANARGEGSMTFAISPSSSAPINSIPEATCTGRHGGRFGKRGHRHVHQDEVGAFVSAVQVEKKNDAARICRKVRFPDREFGT